MYVVVQSLSRAQLCDSWTAAHQAPLSSTVPRSLLKFVPIESTMLSNHLILCHRLLLKPSVFPTKQQSLPVSQLFASGGQSP